MSPIEASIPQFNLAQPPPGFYHDPAPRGGSPPPSPTEQDPMLIHHLANVSRAKLNNLFRSRKDSGLLKHVLIQNLSRSYEDLVPELVTEEREDGYDEIMVQRRTAEEMWLDACLQDLDEDDDEDEAMYANSPYGTAARFYYAANSSEGDLDLDLVMTSSTPALSPDMSTMEDSELDLSGEVSPNEYGFCFGNYDVHDRPTFFAANRKEAELLHLLQAQGEEMMEDWAEEDRWYC